jgi:hypothetical protein
MDVYRRLAHQLFGLVALGLHLFEFLLQDFSGKGSGGRVVLLYRLKLFLHRNEK